jgi:hypothetical protein
MSRSVQHSARWSGAAVAALLLSLTPHPGHAQRGGPFAGLAGSWSGSGSVSLANGTTERLRCRAAYDPTADGDGLQLNLRCNSDSYEFDLRSRLQHQGGAVTGSWVDATRNVSGSVTGRASAGQIDGVVQGPGFSASLSMATRRNRQTVTIRSAGTELAQVSVTLTHGR